MSKTNLLLILVYVLINHMHFFSWRINIESMALLIQHLSQFYDDYNQCLWSSVNMLLFVSVGNTKVQIPIKTYFIF